MLYQMSDVLFSIGKVGKGNLQSKEISFGC